MPYYEIRRIKDNHNSIFDTIDYVAYRAGLPESQMLTLLGAKNRADLFRISHSYLEHPQYNFETYLTNRLNDICRKYGLSLRIIRDIHRR